MAALNHLIVPAKDKDASAKFLGGILGVEPAPHWGPFRPVQTSNGVTLDFVDSKDVRTQHYAFLVDDKEFDASFARVKKAGITYYDTAPSYGDGASEENLGHALRELGVRHSVVVGTKVRLHREQLGAPAASVVDSRFDDLPRLIRRCDWL